MTLVARFRAALSVQPPAQPDDPSASRPKMTPAATTALSVPEILEDIFAYLGQPTLYACTRLVSRDWYMCSQRLLRRELVCDIRDPQYDGNRDATLVDQGFQSKLQKTESLHIITQSMDPGFQATWQNLCSTILSRFKPVTSTGDGAPPSSNIKELTLTDHFRIHRANSLDLHLLLPSFCHSSLTILRLTLGNPIKAIHVDAFFLWLPKLEILNVKCNTNMARSGCLFGLEWSDEDIRSIISMDSTRSWNFSSDWRDHPRAQPAISSNLRALRFEKICFPRGVLESILELSPRLQHLHLKDILYIDAALSSEMMLLLGQHPNLANLKTLALPIPENMTRESTMALVARFGSLLSNWSCSVADFSQFAWALLHPGPETLPWKRTMPPLRTNFVTALTLSTGIRHEIEQEKHPRIGPALHQFLCVSPLLETLDARSISFAVEDLDIYGQFFQEISSGSDERRTQSKKAWLCQRLKALYISFYSRTGARMALSPAEQRRLELENPRNSRLVFGYLTRYAPNLEELDIQLGMTNMNLCWGLPILWRLQKIVRLMVYFLCELPETTAEEEIQWLQVGGLPPLDKQGKVSATMESGEKIVSKWSEGYSWGDMELVGDNEDDREFSVCAGTGIDKTFDRSSSSWDPKLAMMGTIEDVILALDEIRQYDQNLLEQQHQEATRQRHRWPSFSKGNQPTRMKRWPEMTGLCLRDMHNRASPLAVTVQHLAGLTKENNTCRYY
ncbi:hypothetical protein EMPS_03874 [Entomortierella parvispora]|uniref:F-box domain-containing protein n=1 Tax=Entomortierella parvispora TaxID=205924 RepID=A0A9P3H7K0_9FUNG|nr:hypothetical protein EMPS_03874 [Entomortierella parvispora]